MGMPAAAPANLGRRAILYRVRTTMMHVARSSPPRHGTSSRPLTTPDSYSRAASLPRPLLRHRLRAKPGWPFLTGWALSCAVVLCAATAPAQTASQPATAAAATEQTIGHRVNHAISAFNETVASVLFWNIAGDTFQAPVFEDGVAVRHPDGSPQMKTVAVPFVVTLLGAGGVFFTLAYRFVNLRGFRHAIAIVRGKYDGEQAEGEISHFRALTSALSATVGLGNIAGVAIAIKLGGPGAMFWMWIAAFFGMSTKFSSCTLAQIFRRKNPDGSVSGGPMYYLDLAFRQRGPLWSKFGKALAVMYAFMIMGGAVGGGNMFQSNQAFEALQDAFGFVHKSHAPWFGAVLALFVGLVTLGGIKRIGAATSRIVPLMVAIYVLAALFVLGTHVRAIPAAFALIFTRAFSDNALYGGFVGVVVWGVQRASFSNEAGLGSSAIAHAAAKTNEPIREGLVAMLEPFIDTIVVCTMTALVVIVSGAYNDPDVPAHGAALTGAAFGTVLPWFPVVLSLCVLLFAYSTMISWCYYGERGWIYLWDHVGLGQKTLPLFRVIFVGFVFVGSVANLSAVLDFSDMLILCMAFPNIIGSVLLVPVLAPRLRRYFAELEQGKPAGIGVGS